MSLKKATVGISEWTALKNQDRGHVTNAPTQTKAIGMKTTAAYAKDDRHPIEYLMQHADKKFSLLLANETYTLSDAAAAYRMRRGRHPPPGFGAWYQFAAERGAIFVEKFWDPIYHDLHPFWALPARKILRDGQASEMVIHIRNGRPVTASTWFWMTLWLDLIQSIAHLLPDLDIPLNPMDEPRVVVPWQIMRNYVDEASRRVVLSRPDDVLIEFQKLGTISESISKQINDHWDWERSGPFWDIVRRGCPPLSATQKSRTKMRFEGPPRVSQQHVIPHTYHGYVENTSLATDLCHQPDLQELNGIFIEPLSIASTPELVPMFSGSKLSVNNDILLPAAIYWSTDSRFSDSMAENHIPWADKEDRIVWRGVATGGRNRESNWQGFHRHRFVMLNNATELKRKDTATIIPPGTLHKWCLQKGPGRLEDWVQGWSDCAFVDLMCDRKVASTGLVALDAGSCAYAEDRFLQAASIPLAEQFKNKYLPDIDGNSFSGRYKSFLHSSSLPIKATVWREWHDARLIGWKHFVPMDNRYGDWLGIVDYFLGHNSTGSSQQCSLPGHDEAAERIAMAGKAWADRVLRREDIQIYVLRLLLEYARVVDDRRERLGWVEDIAPKGHSD